MTRRLLTILFLATASIAAAQTPDDLPASIKSALDKQYPGWGFPRVGDYTEPFRDSEIFPNFVFGDYDGNGARDYTVRIAYNQQKTPRSEAIIAFLSQAEEVVVAYVVRDYEVEHPPESSLTFYSYLFPCVKGTKDYDWELDKEFVYPSDAFMVVYDGKGSTSYLFENGKFRSVITGD